MEYAIFDLDNCLFDDRERIPLIDWSKTGDERYDAYHAAGHQDAWDNKVVLDRHLRLGHGIIFITARPAKFREQTVRQLLEAFCIDVEVVAPHGKAPSFLLMRNNGDRRRSVDVKRSAIASLAEYGVNIGEIVAAYDDHPDIVEMYQSLGINAEVLKIHDEDAYTAPPGFEAHDTRPRTKAPPLPEVAVAGAVPEPPAIPPSILAANRRMAPHEIMESMAATFKERNAIYGDNFRMVAKLVAVLFPNGVPPELVVTDQWHLFELQLVKMSRFAISNLTHRDSIHDMSVYGAMIESILTEQGAQQ